MDAQAGRDSYAVTAMEKADKVVIVSEYDPISAKGVERLKVLIADRVEYGKLSVVFNKVLPELIPKETPDFLSVTSYLPPIPWNADVVRAFVRGKLPIDMERGNLFTVGLLETAVALFGDEVRRSGEEWKDNVAGSIRQPFENQLKKVEEEIRRTEKMRIDAEYDVKRMSRSAMARYGPAIIFIIPLSAIIVELAMPLFDQELILLALSTSLIASFAVLYLIIHRRWGPQKEELQKQTELLIAELNRSLKDLVEKEEQLSAYVKADVVDLVAASDKVTER